MKNYILYCFIVAGCMFQHKSNAQTSVKQIDSAFTVSHSFASNQIVFEFDKAVLKSESYPFLDSMVRYLIQRDSLILKVKNHTDFRGKDIYSTKLSQRRAQAVVDYMVKKGGIDARRLIPAGFEHHEPVYSQEDIKKMKTKDEQEAAHRKNRRTEFLIIASNYKKNE